MLLSVFAVLVGFGTFGLTQAFAVHATGAFELDGNATSQTTDDWDHVCHQVLGTDCSTTSNTNGATSVAFTAEPNHNASIFTGGGSKDPIDISSWAWKDGAGGLPDKDNLLDSFAARYSLAPSATCPAGTAPTCEVLYFGSDRLDNSGDAQQGFWFFQNAITLGSNAVGGGTGFNGVHKDGDLLVISDFSNGGTTSTITVYSWDHTCLKAGGTASDGTTCGDQNLKQLETSNAANCATAANNDAFCGIVNPQNGTVAPWSYTDKSGNSTYLQGEFYEGGINLSTLGLGNECFSSVASETRSSTSTTATLKDFILGKFGECTTKVKTTPKDGSGNDIPAGGLSIGTGSVNVTDSATVQVTGVSTWSGNVQFSLCGPLTSAGGCTTGGTAIGGPVGINNTTTQPILSPVAAVTSAGTYCWRADFTPISPTTVPTGTDGSTGECFTVNPVTPTLTTQAGAGPVDFGQPVTDTATLTGTANEPGTPVINPTTAGSPAGGTLTFTLYGPNDCSTVAFTSSAVTVSGDGTYGPVSFTPTAPGTYHWFASYTGDPPNTNLTTHNGTCTDTNEDVVVRQVPTQITTAQKWLPNDSATVSASAGGNLSGNVRFRMYTNNTCSGTPVYDSGAVAVSGTSPQTVSTSNTTVFTSSTTVSWLVEYTSNNQAQLGSSSSCNTENSSLTINNG